MDTSEAEAEYNAFLKKVEKTIYVDDLSPQVTDKVLKAAFNQFGDVTNIQFMPNYFESKNMPVAALVEMDTPKQAKTVISQMKLYPLMILGMPRPVRSYPAVPEMFEDRPRKPGRQIMCRWVDPKEPDFEVAKKIKYLVRKHEAETTLVLEHQRHEEEKLANQQNETLKAHYKKYELLDGAFQDGSAKNLARRYDMNIAD
ncbi:hypothetical protein CASFOL_027868 [Castilleja foliolosa]|uniref:RRM domain-containing protein n=1 Tax=Castilleja foliolosa TaxID=1961234 RepID=A0ABD3CH66_9LAMI